MSPRWQKSHKGLLPFLLLLYLALIPLQSSATSQLHHGGHLRFDSRKINNLQHASRLGGEFASKGVERLRRVKGGVNDVIRGGNPVIDVVNRQEGVNGVFKNETNEPIARPSSSQLSNLEGGAELVEICFFMRSPKIGFPQRLAKDILELLKGEAGNAQHKWILFTIEGREKEGIYTMEICYQTHVEKEGRGSLVIRTGEFIARKENGLRTRLALAGYNVDGMEFSINNFGETGVEYENGAQNFDRNPFQATPQPARSSSEQKSDTSTKIGASVAGLAFVIIIIVIIIVVLVPRGGAAGNDRPNVLRRRRFLRWVDAAEQEQVANADSDNQDAGPNSGVNVDDLQSDFSQEVITEDILPTSSSQQPNSDPSTGTSNLRGDTEIGQVSNA